MIKTGANRESRPVGNGKKAPMKIKIKKVNKNGADTYEVQGKITNFFKRIKTVDVDSSVDMKDVLSGEVVLIGHKSVDDVTETSKNSKTTSCNYLYSNTGIH